MRLFGLDHIALIPYVTCNLHCPYCVVNNRSLTLRQWEASSRTVSTFLRRQEPKAIMVSGGEPFIWRDWPAFLQQEHTWYFLTNASIVPEWLGTVRDRVKLIIAAYHHTQLKIERFITNVKKLQDMGYPVFAKIVYDGKSEHLSNIERLRTSNIPASFSPMIDVELTPEQIVRALPFCESEMYKNRFLPPPYGSRRERVSCIAGTNRSFEIDDCRINRCSHVTVPSLLGRFHTVQHATLSQTPQRCSRNYCACEWHVFGELDTRPNENERWQKFVDTGIWE